MRKRKTRKQEPIEGPIEIVSDIPIPRLLKRKRGPVMEALAEMKVGDSFWLPITDGANVYNAARRLRRKVMTRTMFKDGVKGIRVWRVK